MKVKRKIKLGRGQRRVQDDQQELPIGRVPRVSRLMALAIKFEGLINDGIVSDQSELARLAHVTQPRMTQIMNLLHLAPDIQEKLLFLPKVTSGRDPIHEKMLRPICAEINWTKQRELWRKIVVELDIELGV